MSQPPLTREYIADFLVQHREDVRAIARVKLARGDRSVFDSEEVVSSVMRRMDVLAASGSLRPRSEAELWALVGTITSNAAITKARLRERIKAMEAEDGPYAVSFRAMADRAPSDEELSVMIIRLAQRLADAEQRQMLYMRLRGASHRVVAQQFGITEEAARQRWGTIRKAIEYELSGEN